MRVIEQTINLRNRSDWFRIYLMGDCHIGSRRCDLQQLNKDVQMIADDPKGHVVLMGDLVDAIAVADPRYMAAGIDRRFKGCEDNLPKAECDFAIETFRPIAHKTLGILAGNHEGKVAKHSSQKGLRFSPTAYMAEALGVPNLGYCGIINLRVTSDDSQGRAGADLIRLYIHHGHGGGRSKGAKANKVDQLLNGIDADIAGIGHVHEKVAVKKVRLTSAVKGRNPKLKAKRMVGIVSGTYLLTYGVDEDDLDPEAEYGEVVAYEPVETGCVWVEVQARYRKYRAVI